MILSAAGWHILWFLGKTLLNPIVWLNKIWINELRDRDMYRDGEHIPGKQLAANTIGTELIIHTFLIGGQKHIIPGVPAHSDVKLKSIKEINKIVHGISTLKKQFREYLSEDLFVSYFEKFFESNNNSWDNFYKKLKQIVYNAEIEARNNFITKFMELNLIDRLHNIASLQKPLHWYPNDYSWLDGSLLKTLTDEMLYQLIDISNRLPNLVFYEKLLAVILMKFSKLAPTDRLRSILKIPVKILTINKVANVYKKIDYVIFKALTLNELKEIANRYKDQEINWLCEKANYAQGELKCRFIEMTYKEQINKLAHDYEYSLEWVPKEMFEEKNITSLSQSDINALIDKLRYIKNKALDYPNDLNDILKSLWDQLTSIRKIGRKIRLQKHHSFMENFMRLSPLERLRRIAEDRDHPIEWYPEECAKVDYASIKSLSAVHIGILINKIQLRRRKEPWQKLCEALLNIKN